MTRAESRVTSPAELMHLALARAREGILAGQTPFGCSIAISGKVVALSHNTVHASNDITAHAEVNAIREANRTTGGVLLPGALVATTCEPCPMCMAALHWARVEEVHYGASIADAAAAGFNELTLPAGELLSQGGSSVKLVPGLLREECVELFNHWRRSDNPKGY
jgi:guanine deaminase